MIAHDSLRRSWCTVDVTRLAANLRTLRGLVQAPTLLAPIVKGNAYGHGMRLCAHALLDAGADWLCVDSLHEAACVREAGISAPLYILGYVPPNHADTLVALGDCRLVIYGHAEARAFARAARARQTTVAVHLKLETGNHRQGLMPDAAWTLIDDICALEGIELEGISSHFANIEDTIDHSFARAQLERFDGFLNDLRARGIDPPRNNIANSAATLLWPETHRGVVRTGIVTYGMWPSRETLLSTMLAGHTPITLQPVLTWQTRIAQVKDVPAGAFIGYGATFQATHPTRIAVLPVGYYDGYDRGLSNVAHVLIHGRRAPLRGRVCMNMIMVDVTHIPQAQVGDTVVLLGRDGDEVISAEMMADWLGTINYEITTRIHEALPRRPLDSVME